MSNPKTFKYYQRLRVTNPDLYYATATQHQMNLDCEALGFLEFFNEALND